MRLPGTVILGEKKAPWPHLPNASDEFGDNAHRAAVGLLNTQIDRIERAVLKPLKPRADYQIPLTVNGIGPVIAWAFCFLRGQQKNR
jgi:hypothetical protein